jgi:hypothetical protein
MDMNKVRRELALLKTVYCCDDDMSKSLLQSLDDAIESTNPHGELLELQCQLGKQIVGKINNMELCDMDKINWRDVSRFGLEEWSLARFEHRIIENIISYKMRYAVVQSAYKQWRFYNAKQKKQDERFGRWCKVYMDVNKEDAVEGGLKVKNRQGALEELLQASKAKEELQRAVDGGLLDAEYNPTEKINTNALKALLAEVLSERIYNKHKFKLFELVFDCKRIAWQRERSRARGSVVGEECIYEVFPDARYKGC